MSELDELKRRVDALEAMLSGVDRDQSDNTAAIKATHHLVQALSITQGEHTTKLERHTQALARIEAGQATIIALLNTLIGRES